MGCLKINLIKIRVASGILLLNIDLYLCLIRYTFVERKGEWKAGHFKSARIRWGRGPVSELPAVM